MPSPVVHNKYYLKSLHEEIALFDRKLAHLLRYETFASEKDRNAAAAKMSVKRGQLVQTARQLMEEGIEFQVSELPRSLRPEQDVVPAPLEDAAPSPQSSTPPHAAQDAKQAGIAAKSSLFGDEIREYLAKRKKPQQN